MEFKNCLYCDNLIVREDNCSLRTWNESVKYCSRDCKYKGMVGHKISETTKQKMSLAHIGNKSRKGEKYTEQQKIKLSESLPKGKNHWNWKGGVTQSNHLIRNSLKSKLWKKAILERDNYTCQQCLKRGGNMHVDHIKQFAYYPELRFELSNGRTLCVDCHKKTETHSRKLKT